MAKGKKKTEDYRLFFFNKNQNKYVSLWLWLHLCLSVTYHGVCYSNCVPAKHLLVSFVLVFVYFRSITFDGVPSIWIHLTCFQYKHITSIHMYVFTNICDDFPTLHLDFVQESNRTRYLRTTYNKIKTETYGLLSRLIINACPSIILCIYNRMGFTLVFAVVRCPLTKHI